MRWNPVPSPPTPPNSPACRCRLEAHATYACQFALGPASSASSTSQSPTPPALRRITTASNRCPTVKRQAVLVTVRARPPYTAPNSRRVYVTVENAEFWCPLRNPNCQDASRSPTLHCTSGPRVQQSMLCGRLRTQPATGACTAPVRPCHMVHVSARHMGCKAPHPWHSYSSGASKDTLALHVGGWSSDAVD